MKPWFLLFTSCNRLLAHFKEIHKRRVCFQQVFWLKETTVRALLYIFCITVHMFLCPEPYKAAQRHIAIKNNKKCVVNPYVFSEQVKTFLHARCLRLMLLIKCRLLSTASSKHVTILGAAEQVKWEAGSHLARGFWWEFWKFQTGIFTSYCKSAIRSNTLDG